MAKDDKAKLDAVLVAYSKMNAVEQEELKKLSKKLIKNGSRPIKGLGDSMALEVLAALGRFLNERTP